MLLRTQGLQVRERVSKINGDGKIEFSIHPKSTGSVSVTADPEVVEEGLVLEIGTQCDVSVVWFAETTGQVENGVLVPKRDLNGNIVYRYAVTGIEKPQIHPFDIETLYPDNKLDRRTVFISKVVNALDNITVAFAESANKPSCRITPLSLCFHAQADEEAALRVLQSLKENDSVNVWIDPARNNEVLYYSINYR